MTDLPNDRDPRTNPQPGDVLATAYRKRTVLKVVPERRGVGWSVQFTTPCGGGPSVCTLESWRRWARRAFVRARGDAPA